MCETTDVERLTPFDLQKQFRHLPDDQLLQVLEFIVDELTVRLIERNSYIELLESKIAQLERDRVLIKAEPEDAIPDEHVVWAITDPFSCIDSEKLRVHLCHRDNADISQNGRNYLDFPLDIENGAITGYDVFYRGAHHRYPLRISTHFTATAGELLRDEERGVLQLEADQPLTRAWLRPA